MRGARNHLAQDDIVGVRIFLARAGRKLHLAVAHRVVDQLVISKRAKWLSLLQLAEVVDIYVVDLARGVGHQHPRRHLVGAQQAGEPARDLLVRVDAALLLQHQQQRGHERFRQCRRCDSAYSSWPAFPSSNGRGRSSISTGRPATCQTRRPSIHPFVRRPERSSECCLGPGVVEARSRPLLVGNQASRSAWGNPRKAE